MGSWLWLRRRSQPCKANRAPGLPRSGFSHKWALGKSSCSEADCRKTVRASGPLANLQTPSGAHIPISGALPRLQTIRCEVGGGSTNHQMNPTHLTGVPPRKFVGFSAVWRSRQVLKQEFASVKLHRGSPPPRQHRPSGEIMGWWCKDRKRDSGWTGDQDLPQKPPRILSELQTRFLSISLPKFKFSRAGKCSELICKPGSYLPSNPT